jgi:hypothetical protein
MRLGEVNQFRRRRELTRPAAPRSTIAPGAGTGADPNANPNVSTVPVSVLRLAMLGLMARL